jgi:hypothetical protein
VTGRCLGQVGPRAGFARDWCRLHRGCAQLFGSVTKPIFLTPACWAAAMAWATRS